MPPSHLPVAVNVVAVLPQKPSKQHRGTPTKKKTKPAAGTLEAAALSLAQEVSGNPDDWERRRKALYSMQQAVDDAGKALSAAGGGGEKSVFTAEVWRYLREPLKHTLVRS